MFLFLLCYSVYFLISCYWIFFQYVRAGVKRLIATRKKTENNTKQITKKTSRYFCYLFLSSSGSFRSIFSIIYLSHF